MVWGGVRGSGMVWCGRYVTTRWCGRTCEDATMHCSRGSQFGVRVKAQDRVKVRIGLGVRVSQRPRQAHIGAHMGGPCGPALWPCPCPMLCCDMSYSKLYAVP